MDRAGRIVVVWIVGCMIPGLLLIAANAPVGSQAMTDQNILWFRLGLFLIGLGAVGVVVEIVLVLDSFRRRERTVPQVPAPTTVAEIPAPPESEDVTKMRAQLAALQAKDALEQRQMMASALADMAGEADGIRSDYQTEVGTLKGDPTAGWQKADSWNTKVHRVLARDTSYDPTLLEAFDADVPNVAQSDSDPRSNLVRYLAIKSRRLLDIATRMRMAR